MEAKRQKLVSIVGAGHVLDDTATLEAYAQDQSVAPPRRPWFVVRPSNAAQVQALVVWANETATPLVPVSSGAPHFHGDTVPSVPEAVVVDLSRMNAIRRLDTRNRIAVIEPGVTWAQLDAALAAEGRRLARPLQPRANKSVIASLLERQPTIIPRLQYNLPEPLRNCGVVWGTGEVAFTGEAGAGPADLEEQWKRGVAQVDPKGPLATDLLRLVTGAQGTMGIVVWASVRLDLKPVVHEYAFVPGESLLELTEFAYRLLRTRLGDEVALFNATQLAQLLGRDAAQIEALKSSLPSWVVVVGLGGSALFPDERVRVQRRDLEALAKERRLRLLSGLAGVSHADFVRVFEGVADGAPWKLRAKGAAQEIFFLTTLDRVQGFIDTALGAAEAWRYPVGDLGIYIQPQHQGVAQHVEFTFPYDPACARETERVKALHADLGAKLIAQGAYFSRPYGPWAEPVYARDANARRVLTVVKNIVDPKNVLNPGKLCF